MALTENVALHHVRGEQSEFPQDVAKIYEGALLGNHDGYARPLVGGDAFLGHAAEYYDNTGGSAGDHSITRYCGRYRLQVALSGASVLDVHKALYASDDGTYTLDPVAHSRVGTVDRYVTTDTIVALFDTNESRPIFMPDDIVFGNPLPGRAHHGIDQFVTNPSYLVGTVMRKVDGQWFTYAKAGGTLNTDMGGKIYNTQVVAYTTIAANATAGDREIVLDVAGTDGELGNGAIAADELVNGYIVIFPHSSNTFLRRIIGNTAVLATGGEMTVTLDDPLPCDLVVDADHGECISSPYLDVRTDNGAVSSVGGLPSVPATVNKYFWLKTAGIGWLAPQAEVSVGNNNREVVFRHDGSLDEHDYSDANVAKAQHAGWVVQNAAAGAQGAPFVQFNLSH